MGPGVVVHAFNHSTREAEAGGFLISRPSARTVNARNRWAIFSDLHKLYFIKN